MNKTISISIIVLLLLMSYLYNFFSSDNQIQSDEHIKTAKINKDEVKYDNFHKKVQNDVESENIKKADLIYSNRNNISDKSEKDIKKEIIARQELAFLGNEIINLEKQAKEAPDLESKKVLYDKYYKYQQEYFDTLNDLGLKHNIDEKTQLKINQYIREKNNILKNIDEHDNYEDKLNNIKRKIFN